VGAISERVEDTSGWAAENSTGDRATQENHGNTAIHQPISKAIKAAALQGSSIQGSRDSVKTLLVVNGYVKKLKIRRCLEGIHLLGLTHDHPSGAKEISASALTLGRLRPSV